jgi:iron complex transport system permease protein
MLRRSESPLSAPRATALPGLAIPAVLAMTLVALALLSLSIGRADLALREIVEATFGGGPENARIIVQQLRLPRTLLAILSGASLGLAGAVLQGFLRNPLAEPGVVGISTGASLGGVIAIYYGLYSFSSFATPLCAMLFAAIATSALYAVAARVSNTLTLILAGVALNALATALISLAMNLSTNPFAISEMVFWLLGSVSNRTLFDVGLSAPFILAGLGVLAASGRVLDALSLGEETAQSMGLELRRARLQIILGITLCIGASVSVTGGVAFVGLMVPHLLRSSVGHMPSRVLLPSALGGACLLLAADIAVRLMARNVELNLGVLTALIGVPFFFHLVLRQKPVPYD